MEDDFMVKAGPYLISELKAKKVWCGDWEVIAEIPKGIALLEKPSNDTEAVLDLAKKRICPTLLKDAVVEDQLNGNFVVLESSNGRPIVEVALH